jgi:hypothetical protein
MRPYNEIRESVKQMLEVQGVKYDPNNPEIRKRFDALLESYMEFEKMLEKAMPKKAVIERADLRVV